MSDDGVTKRGQVAVPDVYYPTSTACLRSLGRQGVPTLLLSHARSRPASASTYCDEQLLVPDPTEDGAGYERALVSLVENRNISTIIPVREPDIYILSKHRDRFEEHTSLVVPSFDKLTTVHDKLELVQAAEAAGVPVPETQLFTDVTDWERELVIKSRWSLLTKDYVNGYDRDGLTSVNAVNYHAPGEKPEYRSIEEQMEHEPIVQEFVPNGGKYMFAALYDRGEPLATFQHRQIRGKSWTGGGGVYRESTYDPDVEAVARRLLDHLDWHGLACIEYLKHPKTGEFVLLEINPRMWWSLGATVRMGADFPYNYWLHATGRTEAIDPEYDLGVRCHYLQGELKYLASLFRGESPLEERPALAAAVWAVASSCLVEPRFDYLERDDPYPFFQNISNIGKRLSNLATDKITRT